MRFAVSSSLQEVIDVDRGLVAAGGPRFMVGPRGYSDPFDAANALEEEFKNGPYWQTSSGGYSAQFLGHCLSVRKTGRNYSAYRDGCPLIDATTKRVLMFENPQQAMQWTRDNIDVDFAHIHGRVCEDVAWRGAIPTDDIPRVWRVEVCPETGEITDLVGFGVSESEEDAIMPFASAVGWRFAVGEALALFARSAPADRLQVARRLYALHKVPPTGEIISDVLKEVGAIRISQGGPTKSPIRFCWDIEGQPPRPRFYEADYTAVSGALRDYINIIREAKNA